MITLSDPISYVLTEESVYISQLVAEVTPSEPCTFEITTGDPNNYLQIENNGKIYLTAAGVDAINADFPEDQTLEITRLDFTVKATAISDSTTDTHTFAVGVIRIHDEPPYISEEIISPIYVDDIELGYRILELRTTYESNFTVVTGADKVNIAIPNVGRALLTEQGITYIQANVGGTLDFSVYIVDTVNGKELTQNYSLNILPGSSVNNIPTKNILDLVGEHVGQDLGNDFAEVLHSIYNMEVAAEFLTSEFDIAGGFSHQNKNDIIRIKDLINELKDTSDAKILAVKSLVDNLVTALKTEINKDIYSEITTLIKLITQHKLVMEDDKIKLETMTHDHQAQIIGIREFLIKYINDRDTYWEQYDANERSLLETRLNTAINAVDDKVDQFITVTFAQYSEATATTLNNQAQDIAGHEVRISTLEGTASTHNADIASIEGRLDTIENISDLTDYPITNSYAFSDFALTYNGAHVLTGTDTNVQVGPSTARVTFESTWFGNSTLEVRGDYFTGTAARAEYADVAEYYTVEEPIESGTIVEFSQDEDPYEIRSAEGIDRPIGFITTDPAYIMNMPKEESEFQWSAIALVGRIPATVTNAQVARRGDYVYQDDTDPTKGYCSREFLPDRVILGRVIKQISIDQVEIKVQNL